MTPGTELATAGPELSAYHLLDAAGYTAALGEPVTAVEDDGVVPDRYGCEIGQARALTAAGVLITTTLRTADSTDNAKQEYSNEANFGSTPGPLNAGDQSAFTDGLALVQKGAQVLRVTSNIAPGFDPKAGGVDPTAALAAAAAAAGKAAPALAGKMTGATCSGPAIGIPAGAIDPCLVSAHQVEDGLQITGVRVTPVLSDRSGNSECEYDLGGYAGTIYVYTRTDPQLEASISPIPAADSYANDLRAATDPQNSANATKSFESGPFQGFGNTAAGRRINEEVFFHDEVSPVALRQPEPTPGDQPAFTDIILRILEENSSASLIHKKDCGLLMTQFLVGALGRTGASYTSERLQQAYNDAVELLTEYCEYSVSQQVID